MLMFLRTVILTALENTLRRLRRNKAFLAEKKSQGQSTLIKDVLANGRQLCSSNTGKDTSQQQWSGAQIFKYPVLIFFKGYVI